jgi:hypothetical protein
MGVVTPRPLCRKGNRPLYPFGQEVGWASEPVLTLPGIVPQPVARRFTDRAIRIPPIVVLLISSRCCVTVGVDRERRLQRGAVGRRQIVWRLRKSDKWLTSRMRNPELVTQVPESLDAGLLTVVFASFWALLTKQSRFPCVEVICVCDLPSGPGPLLTFSKIQWARLSLKHDGRF